MAFLENPAESVNATPAELVCLIDTVYLPAIWVTSPYWLCQLYLTNEELTSKQQTSVLDSIGIVKILFGHTQ